MLAFAALLTDAGVPKGVVNVVTTTRGAEVMAPVISDPRLRKLSFTGSTEVGKRLIAQGADQVSRMSMELGGNAPLLVFDDADLDDAVDSALQAKMRNGGEACTSAGRLLVHTGVASEFAERLAQRMATFRVGAGVDAGVQVGPLIDGTQLAKVEELVGDARERGVTVLCGGRRVPRPGYFFEPTVLVDVACEARVMHEEIFRPVAPIATFDSETEAIASANATEYGLVAYVFTRDLDRAMSVSEELDAQAWSGSTAESSLRPARRSAA